MKYSMILTFSILVSGCASVDVTKVTPANTGKDLGVRYYRPAPYLLLQKKKTVTAAGATVYEYPATILWLPDPEQEYGIRANTKWRIGSAEASGTLTDGWNLVGFGQKSDSKVPETLSSIASLASAAAPLLLAAMGPAELVGDGSPPAPEPTALLFKIELPGPGGQLRFIPQEDFPDTALSLAGGSEE